MLRLLYWCSKIELEGVCWLPYQLHTERLAIIFGTMSLDCDGTYMTVCPRLGSPGVNTLTSRKGAIDDRIHSSRDRGWQPGDGTVVKRLILWLRLRVGPGRNL
jgi:hypothetical protein